MVLKLYTLFIGLLVALFVGVGIAAFYSSPKSPAYPPELSSPVVQPGGQESPATTRARQNYDQQQKSYTQRQQTYNRNVSLLTLGAAAILLAVGLTVLKSTALLADGLTLGSVFTLIYSIIRGFEAGDTKFRFLVVTAGLVIALLLGYLKFVRPTLAPHKR